MIESQSLPNELLRSRREFRDGIYAANYRTQDREGRGILLKRGDIVTGGLGSITCYGRILGNSWVTVHFEMHRQGETADPDALFGDFESTTFELNGQVTATGAQLHGTDPEGRELWVSMRRLR